MKKVIKLIKDSLNSIPIFFEEEKRYILSKIAGISEEEQEEVYEEILKVEKNVSKDLVKLQKKLKKIEDGVIVQIESKKRDTIRRIIKEAEENDDD